MFADLEVIADKWTSRPFRRRTANLAFYWLLAIAVGGGFLWVEFHPLVGPKQHPTWVDASQDALIGFMFSALAGYSFHFRPRPRTWAEPSDAETQLIAAQISSLREGRDSNRVKWLAAVLVVHTATFSLFGWLLDKHVATDRFPGQQLVAVGLTAAWLVCWGAAASILEYAYRLRTAVDFLAKGHKGLVGDFFRSVHQPLPTSVVHAAVPLALFLLGGYWAQVSLNVWVRILGWA
ncbi:MAG: hypothetical protein V4510_10380 [bacterium]